MIYIIKGFIMKFSLVVDNIKCAGCASHITDKIMAMGNIISINVDIETGQVSGEMSEDILDKIKVTLTGLGYPKAGTQEGLEALGSKAKSFVSCAVGKMNK
jgi:copper chaperone